MSGAVANWIEARDGATRRLHFQHGPIDLILCAEGPVGAVARGYDRAWARFQGLLDELVGELPLLRRPLGGVYPLARGPVARRMIAACWPYRAAYVTPMAAVAGGVAEEILAALTEEAGIARAYVNNGGDIALHVAEDRDFRAGIVDRSDRPHIDAVVTLDSASGISGIATSGWRGRSQSLGIADAVTILACTASMADAAASIVANAVNLDHPAVKRLPATDVKDDSDLGDLLVTVDVGTLPISCRREALSAGATLAHDLLRQGLIAAAYLSLQGERQSVGDFRALSSADAAIERGVVEA